MRISFPFSHHSGIHQLILWHPFFPSMQFSGYHNLLSHIPFDFLSLYGILPCILFLYFKFIRDITVYLFCLFHVSLGYHNSFHRILFFLASLLGIQQLTFPFLFPTLFLIKDIKIHFKHLFKNISPVKGCYKTKKIMIYEI